MAYNRYRYSRPLQCGASFLSCHTALGAEAGHQNPGGSVDRCTYMVLHSILWERCSIPEMQSPSHHKLSMSPGAMYLRAYKSMPLSAQGPPGRHRGTREYRKGGSGLPRLLGCCRRRPPPGMDGGEGERGEVEVAMKCDTQRKRGGQSDKPRGRRPKDGRPSQPVPLSMDAGIDCSAALGWKLGSSLGARMGGAWTSACCPAACVDCRNGVTREEHT